MSETVDILNIDTQIRTSFDTEYSKLPSYNKKLEDLRETITNIKNGRTNNRILKDLEDNESNLSKYIKNLENKVDYHMYIMKTLPIIEEYKQILQTPVKMSFLGKSTKNNKQKAQLINNYLDTANSYTTININEYVDKSQTIQCNNCNNKKDFDIIEKNIYICQNCYAQQLVLRHISSYHDIERINISSKYMYDRKIHFRDCIKQYQGKQNSTILPKIYTALEEQFEKHHLLLGDKDTHKEERFKNLTKNQVLLFLKELGYSNHYENVHLIHYTFTNKKPDDISYLEDQLLDDFDALTDLYDKKYKNINRKNFINTQYVLYQLLRRHKHECNKDEFIILKTIDRKFFHDEVCKNLFEELGWNHTPFY